MSSRKGPSKRARTEGTPMTPSELLRATQQYYDEDGDGTAERDAVIARHAIEVFEEDAFENPPKMMKDVTRAMYEEENRKKNGRQLAANDVAALRMIPQLDETVRTTPIPDFPPDIFMGDSPVRRSTRLSTRRGTRRGGKKRRGRATRRKSRRRVGKVKKRRTRRRRG